MPTNEKNNWDRANPQGENQTDFNRHKADREYQNAKQEAAGENSNGAVNSADNPQDELGSSEADTASKPEFLMFGSSDEDMQF